MTVSYRCTIPMTYPSLNVWSQMHWAKRMRERQGWQEEAAFFLANPAFWSLLDFGRISRPEDLPRFEGRCRVEIELHFRDRRKRDADNYAPKWILDLLRRPEDVDEPGLGIIVDDSAKWCELAPVKIINSAETEKTVITITPLE